MAQRESERENAATPNRGYKGAILHTEAIHTYMHAGKVYIIRAIY